MPIDDNINYEYIIRYIREELTPEDSFASELEALAKAEEIPISQPETIKLIEILLQISGAKSVLEVGSAIGYSAILMSRHSGAGVTTIELSPEMAKRARHNVRRAGLEDKITVLEGDAKEVLPTLSDTYDAIFVDAAKAQYMEFFPHCLRLLRRGGLLISDNVLYKGMTATDELLLHRKRTIVKRLRMYLNMLKEDDRLNTVVLPVGDGVALSYKLKD